MRWVIWWSNCYRALWKSKRYEPFMSLIYQVLIYQDVINYKIVKSQLEKVLANVWRNSHRVRTKEMSPRNVISFWCHSFLSSKEITILKQTSCKFRMLKSSETSFVQTIRHHNDCKETVCIRWQYCEGNWWVESVIYGSIYPFPFLQKSGSYLHLMTRGSILQ